MYIIPKALSWRAVVALLALAAALLFGGWRERRERRQAEEVDAVLKRLEED